MNESGKFERINPFVIIIKMRKFLKKKHHGCISIRVVEFHY